ncbi:hypothetical protein TNCV_1120671 [Trichonephila clavipes]|uniref:Uncharacterized protein n=1 Tax=Trichonephila clavipes TaxID=2585209 RepID=A0A8X6T055_TRICX|nr:hypothetical protein TNCV_1120671 [Trichonephila clavipes]
MIVFAKNLLVSEDLIISSSIRLLTGTHRVIFNRLPVQMIVFAKNLLVSEDLIISSLHTHWGTHRVIFNRHLRDSRPNDSVCKESTCFRGFDHFFPPYAYLHWGTHRVIFNRHLRDSRPNDSVCKESTCFRGFDHFFLHTPTYGGIGEPIA